MVVFTELMRKFWDKQRTTLLTKNFYPNDECSPSTSTSEDHDSSTSSTSKYKRSDHKAYSNATLIRRSVRKQNSSIDYSDVDIVLTVDEPRLTDGMRMVKCHVYESLSTDSDSDTNDEGQSKQSKPEEIACNLKKVDDVGLIIDENLANISAILSSPTKASTKKHQAPRRQQHQTISNTRKSGCWQIFRACNKGNGMRSEASYDSLIVNSPLNYRSRIPSDRFMRKEDNRFQRVVASNIYDEFENAHKCADEEFIHYMNNATRDLGEDSESSLLAKRQLQFCSTPDDTNFDEFQVPTCVKPINSKLGAIELNGVSITLTDCLPIELSRCFVLVMLDESRVFCSNPVNVLPMDTSIKFNHSFYFDNMNNKFEITGKVYCLHHSKYLQRKAQRRRTLLGAVSKKLRYIDSYARELITNNVVTSSFVPLAHFKLNVNNLGADSRDVALMPYGSASFSGMIDFQLHLSKIDIHVEKEGMVTLRDPRNPDKWNRRWCTLTGTVLQFWRFALDEAYNDPEIVIDLVDCIKPIDSATPKMCLPPKTFVIVTIDQSYYLNIDTVVEFREWKKPLNKVYSAVRDWKDGI